MTTVAAAQGQDEPLAAAIRSRRIADLRAASPLSACLLPLLTALAWRGDDRDLAEALPHVADALDLVDLRNTLVVLGFDSRQVPSRLKRLDPRLMPCLFLPHDGGALVVLRREGRAIEVYDGETNQLVRLLADGTAGRAVLFTPQARTGARETRNSGAATWFGGVLARFRGTIYRLMAVTFILNILTIAIPLFTMVVYDKIIGARSAAALPLMVAGVAIAILGDAVLRFLRARSIGAVAGRLDYILGVETFRQILALPPGYTERASVSTQMNRLKEFESIRDFFTGTLAGVVLELPFTVLFIAVIALIGGWTALVPVASIALFVVFGWWFLPMLRESLMAAGRTRAERQELVLEALQNMRAIKAAAAEDTWRERYRSVSVSAALAGHRQARHMAMLQTVANLITMASGVAVLVVGTIQVMDRAMSVGALIATMTLVWRVLSPLQAGLTAFSRLEQVRHGIRQINQLMMLPAERPASRSSALGRKFAGRLTFSRVSFRYAGEGDAALFGASLQAQPGQLVAVVGANGSGKSTLLKLVTGLYQPQGGSILIDGIDIRQIDPGELRRVVAYVPQVQSLFHGTVAQNLRLSNPTASQADLADAAAQAGALDGILALPEGFDTRIGDNMSARLPYGLAQKLLLARALVRRSPILLLDEPATALDEAGDRALMALLQRLRGRTTTLMVSHRPSHIRLADSVVVLDRGNVAFIGPPAEALALRQGKAA
jgi:ATP-binding cassette subfamily C protein/ATP-binding cassette subfamily C protein LapB